MNINAGVLCPACQHCEKLEVVQENLWADERTYDRLFHCEHIEICINAVKIWKKNEEKS